MESITFLKNNLVSLHNVCPYLDIAYEYRDYINTHIIKVKPIECYNSDNLYIDQQISLENEFEDLFPNQEVLFITENELIEIKNPLLELKSNKILDYHIDFEEVHHEEINFEAFIDFDFLTQSIDYTTFEEIDFIEIKSQCNNNIPIEIPPTKKWWSLKNKKNSNKELEFFFN
ncbi:hypothetical protein ACFO5O_11925 [Geojedonia litorea]|uniref:Uncharacterized protein n=1 Tax=Geojedonia litorea TaxID=1268269 RepID=A0ABV9N8W7_9FLAO